MARLGTLPDAFKAPLDPDAWAAVRASHLGRLSPDLLAAALAGARRDRVTAGATIHRVGDTEPHIKLVVFGLLRVYVTAADGRTMTVRYCRLGSLLGVVSLFASPFVLPASIQAVTNAGLVALRPSTIRGLAEQDPRVATALLEELSERVLSFIDEIPGGAFATVRQRVARHLLDLASASQKGPELLATSSQQELADAVGTVREVVVRALRELRHDGLVRTTRDGVVVLQAEALAQEAYPVRLR
jgi:CRP/FNR family transcriptional regulator